jgi:hypothetical protein
MHNNRKLYKLASDYRIMGEKKTISDLVERADVSELSLEDIKGCYDPSKAGFYMDKYLALSEKKKDKIYWEQSRKFFDSPFNGGTLDSFLKELKYDQRFTEDSIFLLFTDGAFHSKCDGGLTQTTEEVSRRIQETKKMWFWEHLRGYGFEHYLDGISGFGEPYSMRWDVITGKKE